LLKHFELIYMLHSSTVILLHACTIQFLHTKLSTYADRFMVGVFPLNSYLNAVDHMWIPTKFKPNYTYFHM